MSTGLGALSKLVVSPALGLDRFWAARSQRSRWAAVAAWYGVIFALSHGSGTDGESTARALDLFDLGMLNGLFRLTAHVFVFGILAALLYGALHGRFTASSGAFARAMGGNAVLALADEFHQGLMPNRHNRPIDVVVDVLGGVAVVAVLLLLVRAGTAPPGKRSAADPSA